MTANANGTFTLSRSALPARKYVGDSWTALDATLHTNTDGTVSPAVAANRLTLSGGGSGAFATLTSSTGKNLALSLPVSLPTPTLSGPTATYPSILTGVDLQVTADTQGGFREVIVVHNAAAAAQVATALTLTAAGNGLTVTTDTNGNLTATDAAGHVAFAAPAPLAWDSTPATPAATVTGPGGTLLDAATSQPVASSTAGPGEAAHTTTLTPAVAAATITLTPKTALLTATTTQFPVYLDPGWQNGKTAWASVSEYYPNTNYYNTTPDPTPGLAQVGNSGTMWSHTLINFPIPAMLQGAGLSATFTITETWSASCTASTVNVYAPSATLTASNATWNSWKDVNLGNPVDAKSVANGYNSSCPAAGVGFNVQSTVLADAAAGKTTQTFVLTGVNESADTNSWKEFSAASATLAVTYDHIPNTPTGLTTSPATACNASTPTTVGDASVSLFSPASDQDGENNLTVTFNVWQTSTGASIETNQTVTVPSGSTGVFTVPKNILDNAANKNITSFSWQTSVGDGTYTSASSTICTFKFDPNRPGQPTVPATISGATIGTPTPINVTFTPSTSNPTIPSSYLYQLNGAAPHQVTADATGNATITITPIRYTNTLTVTGLSAGGNVGDAASTIFNAAPPATPQADQDLTGDNIPDLTITGGTGGIPAGIWTAAGQAAAGHTTGTGQISATATDLGVNGTTTKPDPSAYTGSQVITGHFTGTGLQDILAYYPTGYPADNSAGNAGMAEVINGNGDGSPLAAANGQRVGSGTFTDSNQDNPSQLVNAYDSTNRGFAYPDLIGLSGDATSSYLVYYSSNNADLGYANSLGDQLSVATPTGGGDMAWNDWTIATCQIAGKTDMFLWNKTSGALYLWTNLSHTPGSDDFGHTQYTITGSHPNPTGPSLALHAADINGDAIPDLWTVTTSAATATNTIPAGTTTAYLVTNLTGSTATATAQTAQTVITPAHAWPLTDAPANTISGTTITNNSADVSGGLTATATGGATWYIGDLYSPDVKLDGSNGALTASGNAVTINQDFSVAAWVKPLTTGGVVLSQDATNTAGFKLWAEASDNSWRFAIPSTDTANPTWYTAAAVAGSVKLGTWTQLTATYRQSTGVLNLYINGVQAATTTHITSLTAAAATGNFQIGRARTSSTGYGSYLNAEVANVLAWNYILTNLPTWTGAFTLGGAITGTPAAVYNPNNGNMEVYFNSGGQLAEKTWNPTTGWSATFTVGGAISGDPAAIYNPSNHNIEVYFNSGGQLAEKYWNATTSWSAAFTLASAITGNPATLYDSTNNNIEIYFNSAGQLAEDYWNPTSNWSTAFTIGGTITGNPAPILDPVNHNTEIYFNSGGQLTENLWNTTTNWSGAFTVGGTITGTPAAVYNPGNHNIEICFNSSSQLAEKYWNATTSWSATSTIGGTITGDPTAIYSPTNNNIEIYFNSGGQLAETYWNPVTAWSATNAIAGTITANPFPIYNPGNTNIEIYFNTGGQLTETYWNSYP